MRNDALAVCSIYPAITLIVNRQAKALAATEPTALARPQDAMKETARRVVAFARR
jgi:hypothetical protein